RWRLFPHRHNAFTGRTRYSGKNHKSGPSLILTVQRPVKVPVPAHRFFRSEHMFGQPQPNDDAGDCFLTTTTHSQAGHGIRGKITNPDHHSSLPSKGRLKCQSQPTASFAPNTSSVNPNPTTTLAIVSSPPQRIHRQDTVLGEKSQIRNITHPYRPKAGYSASPSPPLLSLPTHLRSTPTQRRRWRLFPHHHNAFTGRTRY